MAKAKVTQAERLLKVLGTGKTITQEQARSRMGIGSPSKRISELRAEGYKITATRTKTRDGRSVVKYALAKK